MAQAAPIPTFHSLPDEIAQLILEEYVNSLEWSSLPFKDFLIETLPLTWVCSRWRHVGLHTPSLWNHVYFDLGSDLVPYFLETASVILKRSESLPLWMKIRRDDPIEFNQLFEVIKPHLWRLHYLELDLFEIPTLPVLQAMEEQSSQLKTLVVTDSAGGAVIDSENEMVSAPTMALPSLRKMSLVTRWRVPQPPFRASDLGSLTLSMPTWAWDHLQTLLPQYPSIRHLRLDFNRMTMFEPYGAPILVSSHGQFPPISLPNLQSFQTDDPSICFDLATTKALVLHVQDGEEHFLSSTWLALCYALARNSPALPSAAQWRRLENHWANVRTLRFSMIKFDFGATTVSFTASVLACASLVEILELYHCTGLHVILAALLITEAVSSTIPSESHSRNTSSSSGTQMLSSAGPREMAATCLPSLKKLIIVGSPSDVATELGELQAQRPTLKITGPLVHG
ncbi:hypothetical protein DL93DRAFT_2080255 [Clavulina sp. PMI_390]|nr:hypothetical protein DL93DRAFT_2080255 [Clavulina sp. PMI_390]